MSTTTKNPLENSISTVDPYKHLQITLNPDGSITRNKDRFPSIPASCDPSQEVLSKDIPISQSNGTWLRLFLPRDVLSAPRKLPVVVYFHAGGFIHCSAATTSFHMFCSGMAAELQAVVASIDYRLAPEHRLPAAYDDAVDAVRCLGSSQDDWLTRYANLGNCYLMGSSSGANMAFHAALRMASDDLESLKIIIQGLILHQPFFGGTKRTGSELRVLNDPILPPFISDLMWELSLPVGADRDHEYSNPTSIFAYSEAWEGIKAAGWRYLVAGCDGDPLVDRQVEVVRLLEGKGVKVENHFGEGGHHGVDFMDPSRKKAMYLLLKRFLESAHYGLN